MSSIIPAHAYEVRPRKDHRGVELISDALPFGGLWYDTRDNAIGYAMHSSRSHDAVNRVYNDAGNVIETYEHKSDFERVVKQACQRAAFSGAPPSMEAEIDCKLQSNSR